MAPLSARGRFNTEWKVQTGKSAYRGRASGKPTGHVRAGRRGARLPGGPSDPQLPGVKTPSRALSVYAFPTDNDFVPVLCWVGCQASQHTHDIPAHRPVQTCRLACWAGPARAGTRSMAPRVPLTCPSPPAQTQGQVSGSSVCGVPSSRQGRGSHGRK